MEEKPILFSGEMVRAILEERKTHTRRLLKKQPIDILPMKVPNMWVILETMDPSHGRIIGCRYGRPGTRLWVRESWGLVSPEMMTPEEWYSMERPHRLHPESNEMDGVARVIYKADGDFPNMKWKPSIHMPRWASRISLEIMSIRVERVQQISKDDAKAEGVGNVWEWNKNRYAEHPEHFTRGVLNPYIANYSVLWDEINSKRGYGWDTNPWVWVIEFKRV